MFDLLRDVSLGFYEQFTAFLKIHIVGIVHEVGICGRLSSSLNVRYEHEG